MPSKNFPRNHPKLVLTQIIHTDNSSFFLAHIHKTFTYFIINTLKICYRLCMMRLLNNIGVFIIIYKHKTTQIMKFSNNCKYTRQPRGTATIRLASIKICLKVKIFYLLSPFPKINWCFWHLTVLHSRKMSFFSPEKNINSISLL